MTRYFRQLLTSSMRSSNTTTFECTPYNHSISVSVTWYYLQLCLIQKLLERIMTSFCLVHIGHVADVPEHDRTNFEVELFRHVLTETISMLVKHSYAYTPACTPDKRPVIHPLVTPETTSTRRRFPSNDAK